MQRGLSLTWNIQRHQNPFASVNQARSSALALHAAGHVQYQERRGWGRARSPVIPGPDGNREKQKYQQEACTFGASTPESTWMQRRKASAYLSAYPAASHGSSTSAHCSLCASPRAPALQHGAQRPPKSTSGIPGEWEKLICSVFIV